jgi:hypothetical protein
MATATTFDQAWRQLLEKRYDLATLQLAADNQLAGRINAVHLRDWLGDIEPIVVTVCMFGSSESWEPQQAPRRWHSRAGGGAVHGIKTGDFEAAGQCARERSFLNWE